MNVTHDRQGGLLKISLEGELDHHSASQASQRIRELIASELPPRVVLDLYSVPFMDSSGIMVVMGGYRAASEIGSGFEAANVRPQPMKVLKAAAVDKLIHFIQEKDI